MSYILDALKRSETERQRQDSPVFTDVPAKRQQKSMSAWLWLVVGLLAINAIVLGAVLLRGTVDTSTGLVAATEPVPEVSPAQVATPVQRDEPAQPVQPVVRAEPAPVAPSSRSNTPPQRTPVRSPGPAASTPARPAARDVTPNQGNTAQTASLPTLLQLSADGTVQLPELHLDIHVYSNTPQDRFVFVNMTKYREAARLTEGPLVKEIVPEGVILEHRGSTFLLPRD
ncbi:MAG: GspB domain-containing protein [Woeseia sp.]|nr:general secretion pathway protein GspB [Woeseia sp.]NNE61745.1 GspB domain-containing protein [Woeseia sp.]NNL54158.1 GspB domain-containing protein [Woeseia sp.]